MNAEQMSTSSSAPRSIMASEPLPISSAGWKMNRIRLDSGLSFNAYKRTEYHTHIRVVSTRVVRLKRSIHLLPKRIHVGTDRHYVIALPISAITPVTSSNVRWATDHSVNCFAIVFCRLDFMPTHFRMSMKLFEPRQYIAHDHSLTSYVVLNLFDTANQNPLKR